MGRQSRTKRGKTTRRSVKRGLTVAQRAELPEGSVSIAEAVDLVRDSWAPTQADGPSPWSTWPAVVEVAYLTQIERTVLPVWLARAVESARGGGATWAEIGNALGTSRQNAQQRFGGKS